MGQFNFEPYSRTHLYILTKKIKMNPFIGSSNGSVILSRSRVFRQYKSYVYRLLNHNIHYFSTGIQVRFPKVEEILKTVDIKCHQDNKPIDYTQLPQKYFIGLPKTLNNITSNTTLMDETLRNLSLLRFEELIELLKIVSSRFTVDSLLSPNKDRIAYKHFWNEIVFQIGETILPEIKLLIQQHFNKHSTSNTITIIKQKEIMNLLDYFNLLISVQFHFSASHVSLIQLVSHVISSLLRLPKILQSDTQSIATLIHNFSFAAKTINQISRINHINLCLPNLNEFRQILLQDSRFISIFFQHYQDEYCKQLITANDFINVFSMLSYLGIFVPEYLTASLLLHRRYESELTTNSYTYLLRSASSILIHQSLPLRLFDPRWLMRTTIYKLRDDSATSMQKLLFFDESNGHTGGQTSHYSSQLHKPTIHDNRDKQFGLIDPSQGIERAGWYDQSFFDNFDKLLNKQPSDQQLGHLNKQMEYIQDAVQEKSIEDETMADVTKEWVSQQLSMDIPRRVLNAEAVYLIKIICKHLTKKVIDLENWEAVSIIETLAGIGYVNGSLIDQLINIILIPKIQSFHPQDIIILIRCFAKLDVRCSHFFQSACSHVIETSSSFTVQELVSLANSLLSLRHGHCDLLLTISNRKDELLVSTVDQTELRALKAAFRSLNIEFPALDEFLKKK